MHAPQEFSPTVLTALAVVLVFAFGVGAGSVAADGLSGLTPSQEARGSIAKTRGVLASYRNLGEMIDFVGAHPRRCVEVPENASICVWPLSKRERGWRPLAGALNTGDRLNLVCEFPEDNAPRAENSCSVHSQRSNRRYFRGQLNAAAKGGRGPRSAALKRRAVLEAQSRQLLSQAKTAFALSTLVGDAPWNCPRGSRYSHCTWKTTAATYGHGTLAMSIDANLTKKVRMSCKLPGDGTDRAPDSCTVAIGD